MSLAAVLNLQGEEALIVGGGQVALRRARTLLDAGLRVTVVAPDLLPELAALNLTAQRRPYAPGDLLGKRLVVAATGDPDLNDQICAEARAAGLLVNHAGQASLGNLRFPAVAARGGVQVAVGTAQGLPLLAQALAERVLPLLPSAEQLQTWQAARAGALALSGPARETALERLRQDIRRGLWGSA